MQGYITVKHVSCLQHVSHGHYTQVPEGGRLLLHVPHEYTMHQTRSSVRGIAKYNSLHIACDALRIASDTLHTACDALRTACHALHTASDALHTASDTLHTASDTLHTAITVMHYALLVMH